MTNEQADAGGAQPPPLPDVLLDPPPVIAVFTLAWIVAAVLAFTVPAFGTSVFLWQRHAARSGSRGAQTGLR